MEGLLNKALKIRSGLQNLSVTPADADQEAIIRQIELAVSQTKIRVTPELFSFKARNRGILLPLLVNAGTLLVLTIGISILALVFARQQQQQETVSIQLRSAEGTVIAELKKESDAKMAAKEKEIEEINKRLTDIAFQRDNLATNMESAIKQKEIQLRKVMQTELETERQRLRALGLDENEINKRMKVFEKQKTDEFNAKMAAFRKQVDNERQKTEERLRLQEAAFSQNLANANQDRASIVAEAQKREDQLRQQLLNQQNQAAAQSVFSQGQLASAQQEMAKLAKARDQEKVIASQIAGFYSTLRDQLGASDWDKASQTVGLLKDFLNSPQVTNMESLQQRRETELFVAESLMNLIEKERRPLPANTTTTGQFDGGQGSIASQEAMAAALKSAQEKYQADLEKVQKEAEQVQKKLVDQRDAEIAKQLKQQSLALTAQMDDLKKNIQDQTATISHLQAEIAQQKTDLASAQKAADTNAQRADSAEANLKLAADGKMAELLAAQRALELRIASLDKENQALVGKLTTSGADLETAQTALKANQLEHDKLTADLAAKDKQIAQLRVENTRASAIANVYDAMVKSWNDYLQADRTRATAIPVGATKAGTATATTNLVQGKVLLDTFLSGPDLKKAFPGLYDRVHALDQANYASGKDSVLPGLADKLYDIASYGTRAQRLGRLKDEIKKAAEPSSKEFYQNLYDLMALEDK